MKYTEDDLHQRAKYPMLYVDIECNQCDKLMAYSNAIHIDRQYLCPTCFRRRQMEKKSPEIENLLNSITRGMSGMDRDEAEEKQLCAMCGEDASEFRDALSEKEYEISRMCGKCQDKIWG